MKTKANIFSPENLNKILISLFLITSSVLISQNPAKTNYDINDPRNPKCPCHKYQKIADEEYKKLMASAKGISSASAKTKTLSSLSNENSGNDHNNRPGPQGTNLNNNTSNFNSSTSNGTGNISKGSLTGNDKISKKKHHYFTRHKRQKRSKKYDNWKRIIDVKHWKIWKELIDPSSCYHWK